MCEAAGVGYSWSAGREEVKVHDLGMSTIEAPLVEEGVPLVDMWEAICARRTRYALGRESCLTSIYEFSIQSSFERRNTYSR